MKKRGQATAFVILGIIIIIIVVGIVAVKQGFFKSLFEKITKERQLVPLQIAPVQDSLNTCVHNLGQQAIQTVAFQGGYLDLPTDDVPSTEFSPLSSTLEIIPGSDFRTSVWFRERGNGLQEINVPSKQQVEKQISSYVDRNFASCINNLTSFEEKGYEITLSPFPLTQSGISDKKVDISVRYPVKVKIQDADFNLVEHKASVGSSFGELFDMAREIFDAENTGYFLENQTINMLVAYNEEVPFSGTDFSCNEKIWYKSDVSRRLKNIIYENVAAVSVKDTNVELINKKLKYMEFNALKSSRKDVTASLSYIPNWPTLIEINPSEEDILRSDQVTKKTGGFASSFLSSIFCLNSYRFVYDIKYPVLVTLRSPDGLIFQFATQVIVDNNQPRINRLTSLDVPDPSTQLCQYPQKPVKVFTGTVDDSENTVPLKEVSLSFKCFPASCPLGVSSAESEPSLKAALPLCYNGIIEGKKEGYFAGKTLYSSNDPNTPPEALVVLEPLYKKKVNVFVIDKDTGEFRDPYDSEQVSFQFIHKLATYNSNFNYPENNEVNLLIGDYKVNSFVVRNSTWKIILDKEEVETCVDTRSPGLLGLFKTTKKCFSTETEPLELDYVLTGGANFEVSFDRSQLSSDEPLNLYILSSPMPSSIEGLQRIQLEVETNNDHQLFKYPNVGPAS
ncbi:MAG TPA: hypothetical protein VJG30_04000 [Candidatus Nanoarchaeia archaeon]|nr:hypothetical protein [Candidatus Nanoarchaeia archaeon]